MAARRLVLRRVRFNGKVMPAAPATVAGAIRELPNFGNDPRGILH
jgi:hypothetical protein